MAARLGLDTRVWQLCKGVNNLGLKSVYYDLHENIEADEDEDRIKKTCRYCESARSLNDCKCAERLRVWWEAVRLVVLVQPSSAAAERVFSLLKNFWSIQQNRALSDTIRASLFLAYNKREL
jgi:hypothetical protein